MEELIPEEQPVQNIETNQNKFFPFNIHQKLAILIFAALFFLVFGVGAYYVGKQSINNSPNINPSPTPNIQISSIPTNNPQPTSTATYQKGPNITSPVGCPSVTNNVDDCKKSGCYCLRSVPPEGCPQGFIISCSSNDDYLNWPIKYTCFPGPEQNNKQWEVSKTLGDGTFIYQNSQTGEMFRGKENECE